jgi:undecaprenyl-diphosphatase
VIAAAMAFVAAWAAIALLMRWLAHASFTPFVVYRIALGMLLLALIYTGVL